MIRKDTVYLVLTALFFTILITANLISTTKFITIFELSLSESWLAIAPSFLISKGKYLLSIPVGVIIYSLTYLIIDIISEFYGKIKTIKVVLTGFVMSFVLLLLMMIADNFSGNSGDALFADLYEAMSANIIAVMIAFIISQVINVNLYHLIMRKTKGKHLWLRNNVSTIFSQLIDTIIFVSIVYLAGNLGDQFTSASAAIFLMINIFACRVILALLDTPILYAAVIFLKSNMKKFEPFKFKKRRNNNKNTNNKNNNSRRSYNQNSNSIPFID
ncbi:MAG: queuosine precursor transporter [Rickettsiales bacterium]|jgi:queuosine precursor transporter|nr:queuosine precursor transporter [Rickettsiales bacterium]